MKKKIDIERAKHLYNSGLTLSEVGIKLGVNRMAISRLFKAIGFEVRNPGRTSKLPKGKQNDLRLCSCCGVRYVPTKPVNGVILTRLCVECYKAGGYAQSNNTNFMALVRNDNSPIGWY